MNFCVEIGGGGGGKGDLFFFSSEGLEEEGEMVSRGIERKENKINQSINQ